MGTSLETVAQFVDSLYENLDGYVYFTVKRDTDWSTQFFSWPNDRPEILQTIEAVSKTDTNMYLSPVTYHAPTKADRDNVRATNYVWTEYDGNTPQVFELTPVPSIRVQSSHEGHTHCYWRLSEPLQGPDSIEEVTRGICFSTEADHSAWDATQLLRVPGTKNLKYEDRPEVKILDFNNMSFPVGLFEPLYSKVPKNPVGFDWSGESVRPVLEILAESTGVPRQLTNLLNQSHNGLSGPAGTFDRSNALYTLAMVAAEVGIADVDIYSLLVDRCVAWNKFVKSHSPAGMNKQLGNIITKARMKYPYRDGIESLDPDNELKVFGFEDLMEQDISVDWVIEGMLPEGGSLILASAPNVGKTQLTLQVMIHVALGKDFLHYKISTPRKVLFLSLEMSLVELRSFLNDMVKDLSVEERMVLQKNLLILPHGEAIAMNSVHGQAIVDAMIAKHGPEGVFVDSLGSSIAGNINSMENVQSYNNFVDSMRKKHNIFWWMIHHTRKKQQGMRTDDMDAVYGDQYIMARPGSGYIITPAKDDKIRVINIKQRLAKKENKYLIQRTENLNFILATNDDATVGDEEEPDEHPSNKSHPKGLQF